MWDWLEIAQPLTYWELYRTDLSNFQEKTHMSI